MIGVLLRRLWHQRWLSLALGIGMLAVVTLTSVIPLYADAAHYWVLHTRLHREHSYPPFAFLFRYVGDWYGPVSWQQYQRADAFLRHDAIGEIGLPLRLTVRFVRSPRVQVFPANPALPRTEPLFWTHVAFLSDLEDHIIVTQGEFPKHTMADTLPVLVSEAWADNVGLNVGDLLLLTPGQEQPHQALVVGTWAPRSEDDPYWFYRPETFQETFFTDKASFQAWVVPRWQKPVNQAVWYTLLDGEGVHSEDVPHLLRRIHRTEAQAAALLPHLSLEASPLDALEAYRRAARALTMQMTLFSLPILGILLVFLALVVTLLGQRRQGEIAVLRSRGATRLQITGLQVGEGALLGAIVGPLGLFLAGVLARRLAMIHSFLDPAFMRAESSLPVRYGRNAWLFALAGFLAALGALVLPAWEASRHTVISHKQEVSRQIRPPLWQRVYLDVLLLLPTSYGYWILRNRPTGEHGGDFFANPLLFLVPTLFVLTGTLLVVRGFPWVVEGAAFGLEHLPGVSLLLALRNLARIPRLTIAPLTLLALTVGLATFTASTAVTVDRNTYDQVYFRIGADMRLTELGERSLKENGHPQENTGWVFLPVYEHLRVPGVRAAARVGLFSGEVSTAGGTERCQVLGVDRVDFQRVAFFRPDFADGRSLGALMNLLAQTPTALLIERSFLERQGLHVGDPLALTVSAGDQQSRGVFTIVGMFDLFPGTSSDKGPVFVTHLDTIFEMLGGEMPYDVWLRVDPDVRGEDVVAGVRNLGIPVVVAEDARAKVREVQQDPARQGVFGILSAGFFAAALSTLLGFVLVAFISFRRRYVELGVLRALGLSRGQMALLLTAEQSVVLCAGLIAGVGLGWAASRWFIPFLQPEMPVPPFIVYIAWREIRIMLLLFGLTLMSSLGTVLMLLYRLRLFEAVKMGEMV